MEFSVGPSNPACWDIAASMVESPHFTALKKELMTRYPADLAIDVNQTLDGGSYYGRSENIDVVVIRFAASDAAIPLIARIVTSMNLSLPKDPERSIYSNFKATGRTIFKRAEDGTRGTTKWDIMVILHDHDVEKNMVSIFEIMDCVFADQGRKPQAAASQ